jgi:hypothetical protein
MEDLVITQAHLDLAKSAGACGDGLRKYPPGTPLSKIAATDLDWVEANLPDLARSVTARASQTLARGTLPLRMFGDGVGYGVRLRLRLGYGDGYGVRRRRTATASATGYGYGYGYGYGVGVGYGDGYGADIVTSS